MAINLINESIKSTPTRQLGLQNPACRQTLIPMKLKDVMTDDGVGARVADDAGSDVTHAGATAGAILIIAAGPGAGLGLAIAKSIMERQRGELSLDLNTTRGARFVVKFCVRQGTGTT